MWQMHWIHFYWFIFFSFNQSRSSSKTWSIDSYNKNSADNIHNKNYNESKNKTRGEINFKAKTRLIFLCNDFISSSFY